MRLALNRFAVLVRLLSDEELAVLSSSRATPLCTCPALSLRWCRDVCHSTSGLMPSSSSKLSAFPVTITGYPCFPDGPQRFAFRRSVTRPTHSLHLASNTPCWIGPQVRYRQGGYARLVGIGRLPACTHWATSTNFTESFPVPRFRVYLTRGTDRPNRRLGAAAPRASASLSRRARTQLAVARPSHRPDTGDGDGQAGARIRFRRDRRP